MRVAIGIFALLLLLAGLVLRSQLDDALTGACLRVGAVLALWWFAYPQVQNVPRWLAFTVAGLVLLVTWRPKLLLLAIPILAVLWILRPRRPRGMRGTGR